MSRVLRNFSVKEITLTSALDRIDKNYTECGRKESAIWEANKFKTKEDRANVFLFLENTQNAVLHQRVLNKTSLKWRP